MEVRRIAGDKELDTVVVSFEAVHGEDAEPDEVVRSPVDESVRVFHQGAGLNRDSM